MTTNRGWGQRSILGLAVTSLLACSAEGMNELEDRGRLLGGAGSAGAPSAGGGPASGTAGGGAGGTAGSGPAASGGSGAVAGGAAPSAGSGGTDGGAPPAAGGGTASSSACAAPSVATAGVLMDFNDGAVQGPDKGVYVFVDETTLPVGTFTPSKGAPAAGIADVGAVGKGFSFTGEGFDASAWGGGVGIWLNCTDASALTGLKFQLKSDVKVRVLLVSAASTAPPEGNCTGDERTCVNPHSVVTASATEYAQHTVEFASLTNAKPSFDASGIIGVQFLVEKTGDELDGWGWNVSVDEVALY